MQPNLHNSTDAALGQHLPPDLTGDRMRLADVSVSTQTKDTVLCTHPSPALLELESREVPISDLHCKLASPFSIIN